MQPDFASSADSGSAGSEAAAPESAAPESAGSGPAGFESSQPRPVGHPISDADRQRAVDVLERACGEGRLTLEEFSVRVGAAWSAQDSEELARTTEDLVLTMPPVGTTQSADKIVTVFSASRRDGRWRLPRRMRVVNVFGETKLDLRESVLSAEAIADDIVEISGTNVFGSVHITVPEGVEVELVGTVVLGERKIRLAPVQRLAGTPVIRVDVTTVFGETKVVSQGPNSGSPLARWLRNVLDR
jgi:hypothetical protein